MLLQLQITSHKLLVTQRVVVSSCIFLYMFALVVQIMERYPDFMNNLFAYPLSCMNIFKTLVPY